ncbi:methyl-accepting chemotaxis protein [Sporosarcina sp. Sa2YVA2]|uniref:Methyl-accepting chemotaxis protein n=1 Tax=Sporosarcina quadrami TaxID=2762234 RepID=A0ABR8UBT4_9BACL|nr:methyl-accepting chemotaxis protein [Sporosarcina quadrami]MBD7985503.1 methyl-accepting chemotaxis protein [Sporosarcina quadrami]
MRMNIRMKLMIFTALLLIIPSLLIGVIGYATAKENLNEIGSTSLRNNVKMAVQLIDSMNGEVERGNLTLEEAQDIVKQQLIGTLEADGTRSIDSQVDMGKYGYFFVLDDNGVALAHPKLEGQNLNDSQSPDGRYTTREMLTVANKGGGFVEFDFAIPGEDRIAPKIVYAEKDSRWGWNVVAGSYLMDFNSGAKEVLNVLAVVLISAVVIGLIAIVLFARHLSRPIGLITNQVEKMAQGDLTIESLNVKNKDEIGTLATYFNEMTVNLKVMIAEVADSSIQVAATSEELSASSEETSKSVEQVSSSILELAEGADHQVETTDNANDVAVEMSKELIRISTYIDQVNATSNNTSSMAHAGTTVIEQTIASMHTIQSETATTTEMINALGDKSNEIGKIVSMITDVSEQTNLLALNAAIEAARAGEHGKGFAVVADEVKKLAEQSGNAANQVNHLIVAIQQEIKDSVDAINKGQHSVNSGIQLADEAGNTFKGITTAVNEVTHQISDISQVVQRVVGGAEAMVKTIDETARIAGNSADHTQNIAAAAEQQTASIEEIAAASETLAKMAEGLQLSIGRFKV